VDGPTQESWFAQPSGLAGTSERLWVIDAETSALRLIQKDTVTTVVGRGLFDFGHVDGAGHEALLQHPLGAAELPDGSVAIADSYNGAIRRYNPETNLVTTLHRGLLEPSDLAVLETPEGPRIAVVEASGNRVSVLTLPPDTTHKGEELRTIRPPIEVAAGPIALEVVFNPPPGQKKDERYGPSTQLVVSSTPRTLVTEGVGQSMDLNRTITISADGGSGVLHVQAKGASCEEGEFAACHIHQQDWGIPIVVTPNGSRVVTLVLSGSAE
jgi:hypothetical protein